MVADTAATKDQADVEELEDFAQRIKETVLHWVAGQVTHDMVCPDEDCTDIMWAALIMNFPDHESTATKKAMLYAHAAMELLAESMKRDIPPKLKEAMEFAKVLTKKMEEANNEARARFNTRAGCAKRSDPGEGKQTHQPAGDGAPTPQEAVPDAPLRGAGDPDPGTQTGDAGAGMGATGNDTVGGDRPTGP